MSREARRHLAVAEALASCYATNWDDCTPRQQQRFKRDATRVLEALDRFEFFNPEVPS